MKTRDTVTGFSYTLLIPTCRATSARNGPEAPGVANIQFAAIAAVDLEKGTGPRNAGRALDGARVDRFDRG